MLTSVLLFVAILSFIYCKIKYNDVSKYRGCQQFVCIVILMIYGCECIFSGTVDFNLHVEVLMEMMAL
jgi:hypothetical protein